MKSVPQKTMAFFYWFEDEYPEFYNQFGDIKNFYDFDNDSFQIEEIDDAYREYLKGDEPMKMYFGWSKK